MLFFVWREKEREGRRQPGSANPWFLFSTKIPQFGGKNTNFRIGLVLAILEVVFPDFGFSKVGFSIYV